MKIKITHDVNDSAQIIPEVSGKQLIWLEGHNGIGKSLFANILALSIKNFHFRSVREFESLKKALSSIKIEAIFSSDSILIEIDPNRWEIDVTTLELKNNGVTQYYFNDKPVDGEFIRDKFYIEVIRGNEDIKKQLSLVAEQMYLYFEYTSRKMELRGEKVQKTANPILDLYANFVITLDGLKEQIIEEKHNLESINLKFDNLSELKDDIKVINEVIKNISEIEELGNSEEVSAKLDENRKRINELKTQKDELEEKISKNREKLTTDLVKSGFNLEHHETEIKKFRKKISKRLREIFTYLEIKPSNYKDFARVFSQLDELIEKKNNENELILDEIKKKNVSIQETKKVASHVGNIQRASFKAKTARVGNLNIGILRIQIEDHKPLDYILNFNELEKISRLRLIELQGNLEKSAEFDEKRNELNRKIKNIQESKRIFDLIKRDLPKLTSHVEEVDKLKKDSRFLSNDLYMNTMKLEKEESTVEEELEEIESHQIILTKNLDQLSKLPSLNELNAKKNRIISKGGNEILVEKFQEETIKDWYFRKAERERLRLHIAELEDLVEKKEIELISEVSEYKESQIPIVDMLNLSEDNKLKDEITNYTFRINDLLSKINDIAVSYKTIAQRLDDLIKSKSKYERKGKKAESKSQDIYDRIIFDFFNSFFKEFYRDKPFMDYVFTGFHDIKGYDVEKGIITLERKGEEIERSIEAFSTGQKAFAFSRAMMNFCKSTSEKTVLFLDEFGALLDFLRSKELKKTIDEDILKNNPNTIVIFLLPVKLDLKEEIVKIDNLINSLKRTSSPKIETELRKRRSEFKKRISDLSSKKYYYFELDVGSEVPEFS